MNNMNRMTCHFGEIKMDSSDDGSMTFEGYGAVFKNVDSYGDVIAPGAFQEFLSQVQEGEEAWPAMLSQHGGFGLIADDLTPVGVWMDLVEDGKGLKVKGELAQTQRGKDLHTLMKMSPRPAIDGLSIGYIPIDWEGRSKPEDPRRTLKKIKLLEISPVTFPANGKVRVDAVKAIGDLNGVSEIESFLRDAGGFSKKEAQTLISRMKSTGLSDSDRSDELVQLKQSLNRTLDSFVA